jgi:hypothetical protein
VAGPDVSGGKALQIYALVARGARAGVRGATLGREPPPRTIGIRPEFRVQFWKTEGFQLGSIRGVVSSEHLCRAGRVEGAAGLREVPMNSYPEITMPPVPPVSDPSQTARNAA